MAAALADLIAEPEVQLERFLQVTVRVIQAAQLDEGLAEEAMRQRLRSVIAETVSGGQRQPLALCPVRVVPAAFEVLSQGGGELPCVPVEAAVGGGCGCGQQRGVLGLEPGPGLFPVGETLGRLARPG